MDSKDNNNKQSDSDDNNSYSNDIILNISDFSIDHILNRAGKNFNGTNNSNCLRKVEFCQHNSSDFINLHHHRRNINQQELNELNLEIPPILNWLQYTRYRPPKIQRPFRTGPIKRTPGRLPRVPFSPSQLNALEEAYKNSNYLSSEMANRLAVQLNLTNTRIKIWFQNRRARERREKRERGESPDLIIPLLVENKKDFNL